MIRQGAEINYYHSIFIFCGIIPLNSLERDGLGQAELCPRHTMKIETKNILVTSFKYLGAVVSDDGSKPEVLSRIAQATAALTKLKPIWRDNNKSLGSKVKLMRSLVISIFLYACESWTLTAELEKRTQAFEMRCYRRLLNISYKDHGTNEEVCRKIQAAIGEYDELLTLVKKRKLRWFGHVSRSSGLAKTILQGTVKGKKKRQTEEEVGRQYQRVDRNGLCQLN